MLGRGVDKTLFIRWNCVLDVVFSSLRFVSLDLKLFRQSYSHVDPGWKWREKLDIGE